MDLVYLRACRARKRCVVAIVVLSDGCYSGSSPRLGRRDRVKWVRLARFEDAPAALIIPPTNNIRHRGLSSACNNAAEYIFIVIAHTESDPEFYAL